MGRISPSEASFLIGSYYLAQITAVRAFLTRASVLAVIL